jgi:type II secretory pathway pseudopilin PulG
MSAPHAWLRRRRLVSGQDGFTIIEVMLAATMLTIGLLAVAGTIDLAGQTTVAAQRHEQAISVAQREIEELRGLSYASLGHAAPLPNHGDADAPAGDSNPRNPNYYVVAGTSNFLIKSNYRDSSSDPAPGTTAAGEPMVTGGTVQGGPETVSIAGTQAKVYRYITWRDEPFQTCPTGAGTCRTKRITVAVVLNASASEPGPSKPVWVSTYVADPEARPPDTPQPLPADAGSKSQPFFLYDTTCYGTGTYATPTTHATRDTSEDTRNCTNSGKAPDLMGPAAPPGETSLTVQNYSNDVTRTAPRERGLGLVPRTSNTSCPAPGTYSGGNGIWEYPAGSALKQSIHTWASRPFGAGGFVVPNGARTAFSYYTEALDGSAGERTICVILRRSNALDTVLASAAYTEQWPTEPTFRSFLFANTPAFTVAQNERLLVTVSVTGPGGVNLLYDHPTYPTSLTITTTTPISN